jgi:hypothetical protein
VNASGCPGISAVGEKNELRFSASRMPLATRQLVTVTIGFVTSG